MHYGNDIGAFIETNSRIRRGRPCVAGTGVSVHRIAIWYRMGFLPEEIADRVGHLSLAQVHAALTYYHAHQEQIEKDIGADEAEAEAFEKQYAAHRAHA